MQTGQIRILTTFATLAAAALARAEIVETVPFRSGTEGYHTYRIPALVETANGTLLAICEGRKTSSSDAGDIDLVLKRSTDGGASWGLLTLVQEEGGTATITIGNPTPVVDRLTGRVWLAFCRNNSRVFVTFSDDDGLTWSERREITADVKLADWSWYATGPVHGIQLERGAHAGRLVLPCDHISSGSVWGSHVILSDDHGATWRLGGVVDAQSGYQPNESVAVELADGAVYLNSRNHGGQKRRVFALSADGGESFGAAALDDALIEPVVQASALRYSAVAQGDATNLVLFSNPATTSTRTRMTVRRSRDETATWDAGLLLHAGPSAYSDLVKLRDGRVGLLFEKGVSSAYETITFTRIALADFDPAPAPPPMWSRLLAAWEFHAADVAGTNVSASGGSATNTAGTLVADAAATNGVLTLDGAGDYLRFGSNLTELRALSNLTLCAWVKVGDSGTAMRRIVEHEDNFYFWQENGRYRFTIHGASSAAVSTTAPAVGVWQHVLVTCQAGQPARLYVNGVWEDDSDTPQAAMPANAHTFQLGARRSSSGTPTNFFNGVLDDVALWETSLTPEQIAALAGVGAGGYAGRVPPTSLGTVTTLRATGVRKTAATLNGQLGSASYARASVWACWGTADGGASTGQWAHVTPLGTCAVGRVSTSVSGLAPGTSYLCRFFAGNPGTTDVAPLTGSAESRSFTTWHDEPADVAGLQLWLNADAGVYSDAGTTAATNGSVVAQWKDCSDNGRDAERVGNAGNLTYAFEALNGMPAVALTDASGGDYLRTAAYQVTDTDDLTVFVVARAAEQTLNGSAIHPLVGSGNPSYGAGAFCISTMRPNAGGSGHLGYFGRSYNPFPYDQYTKTNETPNFSDGAGHVIELRLTGASTNGAGTFTGYYDGARKGTHNGLTANPANGSVEIGGSSTAADRRFAGAFGDILIYNRALSEGERNRVGWYLQAKYGLTGAYTRPEPGTRILVQ